MTPEIKQRIEQIRWDEVPEGYQTTILGIAPSSWDKSRIDKICRLSSGSTPRRDAVENFNGDILWVTSGELKRRTIWDTREKISETAVVNSHLEMYDPGTVVIAIYGLEAAGIRGSVSIVGKQCTISQACMAFTEFKGVDNEFFYYWYLDNSQVIGLRYAQGTKQQNLSADIVGSFPICFPNQGEQRKIAAILTAQDKVIELKERLLTEKQRQKAYLMQQLLTGKKRLPGFSGAWKANRLRDIATRHTKRNNTGNTNVLTISAQYGLINQAEFFDKAVASDDKSNYFLLEKGDFAYNRSYSNGYPFGAVKRLTRYEVGIVSPLYICFRIKEGSVSGEYLEQYFEAGLMNHEIQAFAQEGARNHGLLNIAVDDFLNSKILLPSPEEQTAIAEVFSAADREIELLQQDIGQEKQRKKALMHLLLTGIVRVTP